MMAAPPEGIGIELGDVTPDGRHVEATVTVDDAVITRDVIRRVVFAGLNARADPDGPQSPTDRVTDAICALLTVPGPEINDTADLRWGDVVVDSDNARFAWCPARPDDRIPWVPLDAPDDSDGPLERPGYGTVGWSDVDVVEWPVFVVSRHDTDG